MALVRWVPALHKVFATHGWDVVLNDIKDEFIAGGQAKIDKSLTKLVAKEKMTQADKDATMARISGFVPVRLKI